MTLPVMLATLNASTDINENQDAIYPAVARSVILILLVFAFFSKYIISNAAAGAVKESLHFKTLPIFWDGQCFFVPVSVIMGVRTQKLWIQKMRMQKICIRKCVWRRRIRRREFYHQ